MLCGTPGLGGIIVVYASTLMRQAWLCSILLEESIKTGFLECLCGCILFSRGSCSRALGCGPPESRPLWSFALSSLVLVDSSLPKFQSNESDFNLTH